MAPRLCSSFFVPVHWFRPRALVVIFACVLFAAGCVSTEEELILTEEETTNSIPSQKGAQAAPVAPAAPPVAAAPGAGGAAPIGVALPRSDEEMPLPAGTYVYSVNKVFEDNRNQYIKYEPVLSGFHRYFAWVGQKDPLPEDREQAKAALDQDAVKAHWAYLAGVRELLEFLSQRERRMLQIDKETNFIARMRTLVFLAKEIDERMAKKRHTAYTRKLYSDINERYFGRLLRAPTGR